uniref:Uncharacterized protein n=1 Tax=Arundo donax TaxID=35708 RepID=A0A0A9FMC0_ARUDO
MLHHLSGEVPKLVVFRQLIHVHEHKHSFKCCRFNVPNGYGWRCGVCHAAKDLCFEDRRLGSKHSTVCWDRLPVHDERNICSDIAVKQETKMAAYVGGWHHNGVVTQNYDITQKRDPAVCDVD